MTIKHVIILFKILTKLNLTNVRYKIPLAHPPFSEALPHCLTALKMGRDRLLFSSCYQPQEGGWLVETRIPLPEKRQNSYLTPGLSVICVSAADFERCSRNSPSPRLASNQEKKNA